MRKTIACVMTAAALAAPLMAQVPARPSQYPVQAPVPLPPPTKVHAECYRPDVARNTALIQQALASGTDVSQTDQDNARVKTAGCTYYKITLASTIRIEDTEVQGVTSIITGHGDITLGLAPDNADAGYDFTSGVDDLTAPISWQKGSALITKPNCIVTTVEAPYTMFAFWLGVTHASSTRVGVRISPAGDELHNIATRCKDPMGRWHSGMPGELQAIFTPAWIALHGEGTQAGPATVAAVSGADVTNIQAYLAKNPNPSPTQIMSMMQGVVPGLDQQLAAAEDNFLFTTPGECTPTNPDTYVCRLPTKPVTMKNRLGFGTIKKITETTVITIQKVSAPPGSP